eukprot:UN03722
MFRLLATFFGRFHLLFMFRFQFSRRDDYRWGNYSSTLQLYGVQPTSNDFPLSIKITLPSTSYLNLQHAWGLEVFSLFFRNKSKR